MTPLPQVRFDSRYANTIPAKTAAPTQLLFRKFERLGQQKIEGHGLGLTIVKTIIEKLGGSVQVESSGIPGKGCTFSFTLRMPAEYP